MSRPAPNFSPLPSDVQPLVAVIVGICLVSIAGWFLANGGCTGRLVDHDAPPPVSIRFTVDVNTAGAAELAQLPGIGPVTAARIVEYRDRHGAFETTEALLDVPGIGSATLDGMRPHLRSMGEHGHVDPRPASESASP